MPWLGNRPGYEDWCLLDGSWALDPLNAFAVAGPVMSASTKETFAAAFGFADDAKRLRDSIGKLLANCAPGRDQVVLARLHVVISDMVTGFNHISDKMRARALISRFIPQT